jgi:hypothetical protein
VSPNDVPTSEDVRLLDALDDLLTASGGAFSLRPARGNGPGSAQHPRRLRISAFQRPPPVLRVNGSRSPSDRVRRIADQQVFRKPV